MKWNPTYFFEKSSSICKPSYDWSTEIYKISNEHTAITRDAEE
jgi:hypothetical protein